MTALRWTDEELDPSHRKQRVGLPAELRQQPGRWAAIDTYELPRIGSARSRGAQTVRRYPDLQYVVRREETPAGREVAVLYMRAVAGSDSEPQPDPSVYADHTDTAPGGTP